MMRKLILLFISQMFFFIFSSCTNDEGTFVNASSTNSGKIIINGVESLLTKAFIMPNYYGTDTNYDKRSFFYLNKR